MPHLVEVDINCVIHISLVFPNFGFTHIFILSDIPRNCIPNALPSYPIPLLSMSTRHLYNSNGSHTRGSSFAEESLVDHHHHHWIAVVSLGWAKASACRHQVSMYCTVFCQSVSLQYLTRSSLYRWNGLPCRIFLSYVLQVVTRDFHMSHLRGLICPAGTISFFSHC